MATNVTGNPVAAAIVATAGKLGVDPYLALSIAQQESGLNPSAVGDNGTSFGLYQLHQGGELGSLTSTQAFNPTTNATVALTEVARVAAAHPGWTPGQIAAAAQRPKNQTAYAASINALYAQISGGTIPGSGSASTANGGAPGANANTSAAALAQVDAAAAAAGSTAAGVTSSDLLTGDYSSQCLISLPEVFGIGGSCLLSKAEAKVLAGYVLVGVGGVVGITGLILLAAYGLKASGAQSALTSAVTTLTPVGRALKATGATGAKPEPKKPEPKKPEPKKPEPKKPAAAGGQPSGAKP